MSHLNQMHLVGMAISLKFTRPHSQLKIYELIENAEEKAQRQQQKLF